MEIIISLSTGLFLLYIGSIFNRKRKKLSYEIITNTQLLAVNKDIQDKIEILYEGKKVNNVHLLIIVLVNDGNQYISTIDYEKPLTIEVNNNAKFLTYEVIDEIPSNLNTNIMLRERSLEISPILLNPSDTFTIKTLISDLSDPPRIKARIAGVRSITKKKESHSPILSLIWALLFMFLGSYLINQKIDILEHYLPNISTSKIGLIIIFIGYIFIFRGIYLKNGKTFKAIIQLKK